MAGTPLIRAASRLPPTAKIQFPTRVRISTHAPTTTIPANHRIDTWNPTPPIVTKLAAKTLRAEVVAAGIDDARHLRLVGDPLRQPEVEATEREERPERDDEARQPRLGSPSPR
ncbi:MAG: hypothetical protein WKF58_06315 [Ilumatobacteraceae bacterium]